jgi:hypothetical protein
VKTATSFNSDPVDPEVSEKFYFNVLVVYDTLAAALRARTVFERLLNRFWDDFLFQCDFWRVDVLELPEAKKESEKAARMADLIIIAADGKGFSGQISEWLRRCADERVITAALVGLFEHQSDSNEIESSMREFLRPIASGFGFFVHEINPHKHLDLGETDHWPPPHQTAI